MVKRVSAFRFVLVTAASVFVSSTVEAKNIYIAQTATGANTGQSCASAHAYTFFNSIRNWGTGANQIGPGTTVHLCGTITSELTAQGSGVAGSPITVLFEEDAKVSVLYCSNRDNNGCINLTGKSYLVLDGGSNGVIEATASGTNFANPPDGVGVRAVNTSNSEIRNLTIRAMYVRTSPTDYKDWSRGAAIYLAADVSNLLIHNNTIHDCFWCINYHFGTSASGTQVYSNEIYNFDHGVAVGGYGGGTVSSLSLHNNRIHDSAIWDAADGRNHHDGIHMWATNGSTIDGVDVYNNHFYGDPGDSLTAHIAVQTTDGQPVGNVRVYNNVLTVAPNRPYNYGLIDMAAASGYTNSAYQNTILCTSKLPGGYGMTLAAASGGVIIVRNNLFTGCFADIFVTTSCPNCILDSNLYADSTGVGYTASVVYNLANWKSYTASNWAAPQDEFSLYVVNAGVDMSTGQPHAGSAGIGAGANLTSLAIPALKSDRLKVPRPAIGPWTVGAYQLTIPISPTNLTAVVR